MAEKLALGLSLTIVGISITFFILFLLQLMMTAQAAVFNRAVPKNTPLASPAPQNAAPASPVPVPDRPEAAAVSPQVIAAVMAAVTSSMGQPVQKLRLVSIRHTADREASAAWSLNNRLDVINRRNSFYCKGGKK